MKKVFWWGGALYIMASSNLGGLASEGWVVESVAARVNDQAILVSEVWGLAAIKDRSVFLERADLDTERRKEEVWQWALDQALERSLILAEFKRRGGTVPKHAVEEELAVVIQERFGGDRGRLWEAVLEERMTLGDLRQRTEEAIAAAISRRQEVTGRVRVSPARLREAYEARRDRYRSPEAVRLRLLVLQAGQNAEERRVKRAEAERLRNEVLAGQSFAELARRHSEGPRASEGGDLGWVEPPQLRPDLSEAVRQLAVGQVSEVIETDQQLFLILLEGRRTETVQPFGRVREELERELLREEEERLHRAWVARLRERHTVQVLEPRWPD